MAQDDKMRCPCLNKRPPIWLRKQFWNHNGEREQGLVEKTEKRTKMNGGKTYVSSWLASSWAKTLTPREPGVGKGVKWGSGELEHPIWALESNAIKSKVCGPKRFSNSFHGSGASMQSLSDKTREGASAWLRGEGTNCKQREIFWARRVWNNSLRASFSCVLLPPCLSQAWISARQSTWASTRQFERTDFPAFKVLTSARAFFTAIGLSLTSSLQISRVSKGGPEGL